MSKKKKCLCVQKSFLRHTTGARYNAVCSLSMLRPQKDGMSPKKKSEYGQHMPETSALVSDRTHTRGVATKSIRSMGERNPCLLERKPHGWSEPKTIVRVCAVKAGNECACK